MRGSKSQCFSRSMVDTLYRLLYLFLSDVGQFNALGEIPAGLKMSIEKGFNKTQADREKIFDEAIKVLEPLGKKVSNYDIFIEQLQAISMLFEAQKFMLKDIHKLQKDPIVVGALEVLKNEYASDVE